MLKPHLYQYVHCTGGRLVGEHILIAEKALGKPLPKGAIVHHVNEIRKDNRNQNLVICQDAAYHKLIHARMRLVALGADPNAEYFCTGCNLVKPLSSFYRKKKKANGRSNRCKSCSDAYHILKGYSGLAVTKRHLKPVAVLSNTGHKSANPNTGKESL